MPPVTPSPHRFLPGRRQPSPQKSAKPQSALRQEAHVDHDAIPPRTRATPGPSQFARTPHFAHGKLTQARAAFPQKPTPAQALFTSLRPAEDVEEVRPVEDADDEMLDNEPTHVLPTTEQVQQDRDELGWLDNLPYSPKRRRLNEAYHDNAHLESPSRPLFKLPQTPASHMNYGPQQSARAGSVASTTNDEQAKTNRPAFLRSSVAPPDRLEPLPEAFSPHRRGEKFVPGGMAATLQQWIIETGQSAAHSRKGQGYLRGEDYVVKVKVDEVNGGKPLLVQGRQPDAAETRLLLVVDGKQRLADVATGSVVGVRAPTWEVIVDGMIWVVGVDWKIL